MKNKVRKNDYRSRSKIQDFLVLFLTITITLFTISLLLFGIVNGSIALVGNIDVDLIMSIIAVTGLMSIFRMTFGKNNVSE